MSTAFGDFMMVSKCQVSYNLTWLNQVSQMKTDCDILFHRECSLTVCHMLPIVTCVNTGFTKTYSDFFANRIYAEFMRLSSFESCKYFLDVKVFYSNLIFKKAFFFQITAVFVSRKLLLVNNYLLFKIKIQHFDLSKVHKQRMPIFSSTVLKHNVQTWMYNCFCIIYKDFNKKYTSDVYVKD